MIKNQDFLFQALVTISQPDSGKVWIDGPIMEKYGQVVTNRIWVYILISTNHRLTPAWVWGQSVMVWVIMSP